MRKGFGFSSFFSGLGPFFPSASVFLFFQVATVGPCFMHVPQRHYRHAKRMACLFCGLKIPVIEASFTYLCTFLLHNPKKKVNLQKFNSTSVKRSSGVTEVLEFRHHRCQHQHPLCPLSPLCPFGYCLNLLTPELLKVERMRNFYN